MEAASNLPEVCHFRNSSCFSADSLSKLQQMMNTHTFKAGATLFLEGDPVEHLYYIRSGRVKVTKNSDQGREYIMYLFHTGDFVGQLDLAAGSRYGFTAHVVDKCEIGMVAKSELELLLWQYSDLSLEFIKWMGYMHRLTQTKYRDLMLNGKPGALSSTLIRLANTYGTAEAAGIRISLRLTHSELADYIGCARESVNRMLGELKKAGAITMNNGILTITNLRHLQMICNCEGCPREFCRV